MIYLLQDDFFGNEQLAALKKGFGDRGMQELNTTSLDGQKIVLDELIRACEAVPFLADWRLVIVRRLLGKFEPKHSTSTSPRKSQKSELEKQVCEFLGVIPDSTDLVFVEERVIPETNAVHKAIRQLGGKVVQGKTLKGSALQDWIQERVKAKNGQISQAAAYEMAAYAGDDLRALDGEIDKLVAFADPREISERDVRLLATNAKESTIFNLVDAVGRRDVRSALQILQELLADGMAPQYLIVMITRQFRLLLQTKELMGQGSSPENVAAQLRLHPFAARKAAEQARNFTAAQLEKAYFKLAEIDQAVKTGRMRDETAAHLLVTELGMGARPTAL